MSLSKASQAGPGRVGPLILIFFRYIEKTSLARNYLLSWQVIELFLGRYSRDKHIIIEHY